MNKVKHKCITKLYDDALVQVNKQAPVVERVDQFYNPLNFIY